MRLFKLAAAQAAGLVMALGLAAPLAAQPSGPSPAFRDAIHAAFPTEPYAGVTVARDLAYGRDAKQKLDVFTPKGAAAAGRPVVIFLHGGGFEVGDKKDPDDALYDNVMLFLSRNGVVGVNMNYRLHPRVSYPAQEQDLALAVRWVKANIARYGGDPARIVLWGHSSGGSVVANYVGTPSIHGPDGPGVRGAILLSAPMDLTSYPDPFGYFGEDRSTYRARSPLTALLRTQTPILIGMADGDLPSIPAQQEEARKALCAAGHCPEVVTTGGDHMSEMVAIGGPGDPTFSKAVLAFLKRVD